MTATAALAGVVLLLALVASIVRPQEESINESAVESPRPWQTLTQITSPLGEEFRRPIPNPLIREARLIIEDARQAVVSLQHRLPASPRFDQSPSSTTNKVRMPVGDGA
jgi:hypothetical protein